MIRHLVVAFIFALLSACGSPRSDPTRSVSSQSRAAEAPPTGDACSAQTALDKLDGRAPLPLLPMMASHQKQNMRDHLLAVQEVVAGLAADDFALIEQAAARLGYSEQMGRMCSHMGAGAPGFSERALSFHHTADGIGGAARARDRAGVTKALGATLRACTDCHALYKQSIVDEATWSRIGSGPVPAGSAQAR